MFKHYIAVTLPLFLSILVVFLVPIMEAATLIHFAPEFLIYIGLAVPILTLLTLGTRLYAQLDANAADAHSPEQLGDAMQRSLVVTIVLLAVSTAWVFVAIDWTGKPSEWPWLICSLLVGGAFQTPRYFTQSISARGAHGMPTLLASLVMVAISAIICLCVWLAGPPARSAVAIVMIGSALAAIAGAVLTMRLFARAIDWRRALSLRMPHFRADILRTHAFSMVEVFFYNLMCFAFFTALSKQSASEATTFQFISTLALVALSWRITYTILFQTAMSEPRPNTTRLWSFAAPMLANSFAGIALAGAAAIFLWPEGSYALSILTVALINLFGTFNMLALAGLRAVGRMGRMGAISAAVNSLSVVAFLLLGERLGVAGIFCVFVADEIVRAVCSTSVLHSERTRQPALAV